EARAGVGGDVGRLDQLEAQADGRRLGAGDRGGVLGGDAGDAAAGGVADAAVRVARLRAAGVGLEAVGGRIGEGEAVVAGGAGGGARVLEPGVGLRGAGLVADLAGGDAVGPGGEDDAGVVLGAAEADELVGLAGAHARQVGAAVDL